MSRDPVCLCACGCGQRTSILRKEDSTTGLKRGERVKFIQGHNRTGRFVPPEEIVKAYRSGLSLRETAETLGTSVSTVARRVRAAGAIRPLDQRRRPSGNYGRAEGDGPGRFKWLDPAVVLRAAEAGSTYSELAECFGVSRGTIYRRIWEAKGRPPRKARTVLRPPRERLVQMYCKEELDSYQIAAIFGVGQPTAWEWLDRAGIERRPPGTRRSASSLGGLWFAFEEARRRAAGGLSQKQQDCLTLLTVATAPLSARQISEVFKHVSIQRDRRHCSSKGLRWIDWTPEGVRSACRRLETRGHVASRMSADGQLVWLVPTSFAVEDAAVEVELRHLIEEQNNEDTARVGHHNRAFSFQAEIGDTGLTREGSLASPGEWWEEAPA